MAHRAEAWADEDHGLLRRQQRAPGRRPIFVFNYKNHGYLGFNDQNTSVCFFVGTLKFLHLGVVGMESLQDDLGFWAPLFYYH